MSDGKDRDGKDRGGNGREGTPDELTTQRLSTEGADMLTLAGVNDSNLIELARLSGVKVALRGDTLTLDEPVHGAAPGQIACLLHGDVVVGCATIVA